MSPGELVEVGLTYCTHRAEIFQKWRSNKEVFAIMALAQPVF
jgi:hypothetical protein